MRIVRWHSLFPACFALWTVLFYSVTTVYAIDLLPTCGPESWSVNDDSVTLGENGVAAMTLDEDQNLIVMVNSPGNGNNLSEWYILKYNPSGKLLWRYFYPGTGSADGVYNDQGVSLALDQQGNIYAVGNSLTLTQRDIVILKLSSNGEELWMHIFDGAAPASNNQDDLARAIALANDHVYIFGQTWSDETHTGNMVLLYQLDGTFARQLELPTYTLAGFAFLPSGEWVSSGLQYKPLVEPTIYLAAYAADGAELWHTTYNSAGKSSVLPGALRLDPQNNIYMVMDATRTDANFHDETISVVAKYAPTGQFLWERIYYTTRSSLAMTLDPVGNVYLLGDLDDPAAEEFSGTLALKYNPDGLLVATFQKPVTEYLRPLSIAVDGDAGVILTGVSELRDSATPIDTVTTMYFAPDGSSIWVARHPAAPVRDPLRVGIVHQSYIVIATTDENSGTLLLLRYPLDPPHNIPQVHVDDYMIGDGDISSVDQRLTAFIPIQLDRPAADDIYVEYFTMSGTAQPDVDFVPQAGTLLLVRGDQQGMVQVPIIGNTTVEATLKQFTLHLGCVKGATSVDGQAAITILDDDGDRRLWTKTFGDGNATSMVPGHVLTDPDDALYIVGAYHDATYDGDILLKYRPDGSQAWQQQLAAGYAPAFQIDPTQQALYATVNAASDTNADIVTQRTNLNGDIIWTNRFDSSPVNGRADKFHDVVNALAFSSDGTVVIGGLRRRAVAEGENPSDSDALIVALAANGVTKWQHSYAGPPGANDEIQSIAMDSAGNTYAIGVSYKAPTDRPLLWLKFDPNGQLLQQQVYAFPDAVVHTIVASSIDRNGIATVVVDGEPMDYGLRLDSSGKLLWRTMMITVNADTHLLLDSSGYIYLSLAQHINLLNREGQSLALYPTTPPSFFPTQSMAWGADELIYGASEFGPVQTTGEAHVGALDRKGNRLWRQSTYTDTGPETTRINLVAPLPSGGTYVVGYIQPGGAAGYQLFLQRYQAPLLPIRVSLQSVTWQESVGGTTIAQIPVLLSHSSAQAIQIAFSTQAGTASAGIDFSAKSGVITIPAGQLASYIEIPILPDDEVDNAETFFVRLDQVQNGIADKALATIMIIDAAAQPLFMPIVANR